VHGLIVRAPGDCCGVAFLATLPATGQRDCFHFHQMLRLGRSRDPASCLVEHRKKIIFGARLIFCNSN